MTGGACFDLFMRIDILMLDEPMKLHSNDMIYDAYLCTLTTFTLSDLSGEEDCEAPSRSACGWGSTWRMVRFTMIVFLDKPVSRVNRDQLIHVHSDSSV